MLQPVKNTENQTGLSSHIHNSIHTYLTEEIVNNLWNAQDIELAYSKYNLFSPSYLQYDLNNKQPKDLRCEFLEQVVLN